MVLSKKLVLRKELWDQAKNYETLVYNRKNYDTIEKLRYYSTL